MRSSALIRSKKFACFSPKFSERLPNIIRNKWLYSSFESSLDIGEGGEGGRACFAWLFLGELANKNTARKTRGSPARGQECLAISAEDRGFKQRCGKQCMGGDKAPHVCLLCEQLHIFPPLPLESGGGQSRALAQESCLYNHTCCSRQGPRHFSGSQSGV